MNNKQANLLALYLDQRIGDGKEFDSNVALAEESGLAEGTIRRIRNGNNISTQTFGKLASAFGLKSSELQQRLEELDSVAEIGDELDGIIGNIIRRLPPSGKRLLLAMAKELLAEQFAETDDERPRRVG